MERDYIHSSKGGLRDSTKMGSAISRNRLLPIEMELGSILNINEAVGGIGARINSELNPSDESDELIARVSDETKASSLYVRAARLMSYTFRSLGYRVVAA